MRMRNKDVVGKEKREDYSKKEGKRVLMEEEET